MWKQQFKSGEKQSSSKKKSLIVYTYVNMVIGTNLYVINKAFLVMEYETNNRIDVYQLIFNILGLDILRGKIFWDCEFIKTPLNPLCVTSSYLQQLTN